jgi:hypothetical protein
VSSRFRVQLALAAVCALIALLIAKPWLEDIRVSTCDGKFGFSSHRSCRSEALALRFAQTVQSRFYGMILHPDQLSDAQLRRTLQLLAGWDCIGLGHELQGQSPLHRDGWRALVERDPSMGFELPLDFFEIVQQCRLEAGRRSFIIHLTLNDERTFTLGERGEWLQTP